MSKKKGLFVFDLFGVVFTKSLVSSIDKLTSTFGKPMIDIEKEYTKWEKDFDLGNISDMEFWAKINRGLKTKVDYKLLNEIVLDSISINSDVVELAQELKRSNYNVIAYSNYRKIWFDKLNDRHDIYSAFEEVFISSETGILKPDRNVFEFLRKKYNYDKRFFILIDDNKDNINSILDWGGKGIHYLNLHESKKEIIYYLNRIH